MVAYRVIFLGVLSYLLSAHNSYAQTHLQKEIYLRPGAAQLDSALQSVRRQTGMVFSYNAKKLNTKQKVLIPSNLRTLSDFLDLLQKEKKWP